MLYKDDADLFYEVVETGFKYAKKFGVHLTGITTKGRPNRNGSAGYVVDGGIVLVFRYAETGKNGLFKWEEKARHIRDIYGTFAYCLAVLREKKEPRKEGGSQLGLNQWFETIATEMEKDGLSVNFTPHTARI